MKKLVQFIGALIAGTGVITISSCFENVDDEYGPPPQSEDQAAIERCCKDAANYEQCVKAFQDNNDVCPTNNDQKRQNP